MGRGGLVLFGGCVDLGVRVFIAPLPSPEARDLAFEQPCHINCHSPEGKGGRIVHSAYVSVSVPVCVCVYGIRGFSRICGCRISRAALQLPRLMLHVLPLTNKSIMNAVS